MYDDRAEEVVQLLTPDKDLPPIPSDASSPSPDVANRTTSSSQNVFNKSSSQNVAINTSSSQNVAINTSSSQNVAIKTSPTTNSSRPSVLDTALDKLDNLVKHFI